MKNKHLFVLGIAVLVAFNLTCFALPKSDIKYVIWFVANVAMAYYLSWLCQHRNE